MSDTLASLAIELGVDLSQLRSGFTRAVSDAKSAGGEAGDAFTKAFHSPILQSMYRLQSMIGVASDAVQFFGAASGSRVAAEFGDYRRQLVGIAGDASKAERAFKALQNTAMKSNFDTGQVEQFGVSLAGRYGDVDRASREVQQTVDAAQVAGVQNSNFNAFQTNMRDIQNKGDNKIERPDLEQLRRYAPTLSAAMARAYGISVAEASKKIEGATGNELSNMILQLGQRNVGAADRASGSDPYKVAANTVDSFNTAMEPTGRIVNEALLPLALIAKNTVEQFGQLNAATGGGAGLVAMVAGGSVAVRFFGGGLRAATTTVGGFTAALAEATIALNTKSAADGVKTSAGAVGTAASASGGAANLGLGGTLAAAGNILSLAIGSLLLMQGIQQTLKNNPYQDSEDPRRRVVGGILKTVGEYSEKGQQIGTAVPLIGPLGGAALGTGVGWAVGGYQAIANQVMGKNEGKGDKSPQEAHTEALKRNTEALDKANRFRTSQVGGGDRVAGALQGLTLEAQHAILRSTQTGLA